MCKILVTGKPLVVHWWPIPGEQRRRLSTEISDIYHFKTNSFRWSVQVSLDQYHTEEEIYQMSLQREPRKPAVSSSILMYSFGPAAACSQITHIWQWYMSLHSCLDSCFMKLLAPKLSGSQRVLVSHDAVDTVSYVMRRTLWETVNPRHYFEVQRYSVTNQPHRSHAASYNECSYSSILSAM